MDFCPQPVLHTCHQHPFGFVNRKETLVAEHINVIGKFLGSNTRNHFIDNQINVLRLPSLILGRHRMGTQKGAHDFYRGSIFQPSYHP